jgi:hypothetical protein
LTNPIPRVDGRTRGGRRRTQVGTPEAVAAADVLGEALAVVVGSYQTAEVSPEAAADARDEEGHRG